MMIGGEFNTPADWIRAGNVLPIIDGYAATHAGFAPILVLVDAGGTFNNDTECVDGPRGNAADHLTRDVPPFVETHFGASADPRRWGVVGWSMGGTCSPPSVTGYWLLVTITITDRWREPWPAAMSARSKTNPKWKARQG